MPDDYRGEFWGVTLWEGIRKNRGIFFLSFFLFFTVGASVLFGEVYKKHMVLFQLKRWGQCGDKFHDSAPAKYRKEGEREI